MPAIVKVPRFVNRAAIIVALTWVAIELHEFGHFLVYTISAYHARMSLQRVSPIGEVPASLDHVAKLAGPAVSLIAAVVFLAIARRRRGFAWITAAFTNATLRLFPNVMDLLRAVKGTSFFSDEGEVALALTPSPVGRSIIIGFVMILGLVLTVLCAREFKFQGHAVLKSFSIYLLSLTVGIAVVIADELLGWNK